MFEYHTSNSYIKFQIGGTSGETLTGERLDRFKERTGLAGINADEFRVRDNCILAFSPSRKDENGNIKGVIITADNVCFDNSSKKTLSEYLYTYNQSASEENKYKLSTFVNEGGQVFNYSRGEEWNTSNFYNYRVNPFIVNTDEGFTMNFDLVGLDMNISYYVLIELFYNLPDELLDGALSLTERLNLEISYAITSQFDEK